MKIGILTYHRSHNYGALLQAIALRSVLCDLGHSASFIDYWPGYHKRMYAKVNWIKTFNFLHPINCIQYISNRLLTWKNVNRRIRNVSAFIAQYIEPYCSSMAEEYDVVVCGSDQIWRKQPERVGFNPVYFGKNNISAHKQISYAASMGLIPTLANDRQKVQDLIKNLDCISVRENDLNIFLRELGFNDVSVNLDPTLLLNAEKWTRLIPKKRYIQERYALFYEVSPGCFDERKLSIFCDYYKLKLVILRTNSLKAETTSEHCTESPDVFVNLIRYADFVFSSSFHGLAFSIINHKNFLCSASHGSSRLVSLLERLGISNHYIEPGSNIPTDMTEIDYVEVERRLFEFREDSIKYLENSIK